MEYDFYTDETSETIVEINSYADKKQNESEHKSMMQVIELLKEKQISSNNLQGILNKEISRQIKNINDIIRWNNWNRRYW